MHKMVALPPLHKYALAPFRYSPGSVAWAALLVLLTPFPVLAQSPPDAGALQREIEQAIQPPALRTPAPPVLSPPMAEQDKAVRVTVRGFVIEGAALIPNQELTDLLADQVGQSLTLAELEGAAQRLAEYYRQRGWYVRVYLPAQDATEGLIRIQVVEGHYGGSRLDGQPTRANAGFVEKMVTHGQTPGAPLSAADLERGLLLASDLPGLKATGILEPGEKRGDTRLLLKVEDTPLFTGDLGANNHGVKSTGTGLAVAGAALNNLSGIGDRLAFRGLTAEDVHSGLLQYSLPLGVDGWRLGAHASALRYRLGGEFANLDAEGDAQAYGTTLTWQQMRSLEKNLTFTTRLEHRRYNDDALDAPLRRHRVDAAVLGMNGDFQDSLAGGGFTWGRLQLTSGNLDIQDVAGDLAVDQAGPKRDGGYNKLDLQLDRSQHLAPGWSIHAAFSAQLTDTNLGSSEKFVLGGPNGVRAYPINEASGDEGWLLNLELQRDLTTLLGLGWQANAFVDTGRIRLNKDTWPGWEGGGDAPNRYSLSGVGVGLDWNRPGGWIFSSTMALPLGNNPGRTATDRNNDGTNPDAARFWLSLTKFF